MYKKMPQRCFIKKVSNHLWEVGFGVNFIFFSMPFSVVLHCYKGCLLFLHSAKAVMLTFLGKIASGSSLSSNTVKWKLLIVLLGLKQDAYKWINKGLESLTQRYIVHKGPSLCPDWASRNWCCYWPGDAATDTVWKGFRFPGLIWPSKLDCH